MEESQLLFILLPGMLFGPLPEIFSEFEMFKDCYIIGYESSGRQCFSFLRPVNIARLSVTGSALHSPFRHLMRTEKRALPTDFEIPRT
jgi:hypothetical protein